jgi:LysR family transcriptional regulator, hydrogen peroxide-inducible genes activator
MQLRHVQYFVALSEELNFTRAARRCGVSQPSLTNAIVRLERHFGGQLFARKPRLELTEMGAALRPYLFEIDRLATRVLETARLSASSPAGK